MRRPGSAMLTAFFGYAVQESQVMAAPFARSMPTLTVPLSRRSNSSPRGPMLELAAVAGVTNAASETTRGRTCWRIGISGDLAEKRTRATLDRVSVSARDEQDADRRGHVDHALCLVGEFASRRIHFVH